MIGRGIHPFVWLVLWLVSTPSCFGRDGFGSDSIFEIKRDMCTLDAHCLNGGECMPPNEGTNFKHCHCQPGFSGPRCSRFCPLECKNGGYCTVTPQGSALGLQEQIPTYDPNDYTCKCFGHFAGPNCDIPYVNCGKSRCFNKGVCLVGDKMLHQCSCPKAFGGDSCETELSEDSPALSKGGKNTVLVISIMLACLGINLVVAVMRKRESPPESIEIIPREEEEEHQKKSGYTDSIVIYDKPPRAGGIV